MRIVARHCALPSLLLPHFSCFFIAFPLPVRSAKPVAWPDRLPLPEREGRLSISCKGPQAQLGTSMRARLPSVLGSTGEPRVVLCERSTGARSTGG